MLYGKAEAQREAREEQYANGHHVVGAQEFQRLRTALKAGSRSPSRPGKRNETQ